MSAVWFLRAPARGCRGHPLRKFQRDPAPVLALLEILKDDPELNVRGSILNSMNDIGKDHLHVMVDFRIHYIKANGKPQPKEFKLKSVDLKTGESVQVKKSISVRDMTTRKHYPGKHAVYAIVNDSIRELGFFHLEAGPPEC